MTELARGPDRHFLADRGMGGSARSPGAESKLSSVNARSARLLQRPLCCWEGDRICEAPGHESLVVLPLVPVEVPALLIGR